MRIKFNKELSAVEQNNYTTKIVNVYIFYDLDAWRKNPTNNFNLKNCLFGATNIVKNSDKLNWIHSGYGIIFDETDWYSFSDDFTGNAMILVVDNNLSSNAKNGKNNLLVLGKGPTFVIKKSRHIWWKHL